MSPHIFAHLISVDHCYHTMIHGKMGSLREATK